MKIREIFTKGKPSFSFEFFPPKDEAGYSQLFKTIENLKPKEPSYVSVTFGAGGSTRQKTVALVGQIKNKIGIESMAHLTCVGSSQGEIRSILDTLDSQDIQNILALRGDPPSGETEFKKPDDGFGFANELVSFIKENYSFCVGVAGYPEGHVECPDKSKDLENLKRKVDAGADFIVTQLFFDNRRFFDFMDKTISLGISIPIVPGIMPILNLKQTKRFTKMCGASIPESLMLELEKHESDADSIRSIGTEHALKQCEELIANGAPGVHFYTLNRSKATLKILESLKI